MRLACRALGTAALMLCAAAGCSSQPEIEWGTPSSQAAEGQPELRGWEQLVPTPVQDPRRKPHFIPAEDAGRAPTLDLSTFGGQRMRVEPGEPGKVTIVVFWSLDLPVTKAAARHVADLEEKYRGLGVIALGIVEKDTKDSERASQFMLSQGINYPGYYDDFKALRAMGRAAGAKVKKELPCFFLVDREQRVRLFKRGFSFTGWLAKYPRTGDEQVVENAAPGERIEDFLRQLLDER